MEIKSNISIPITTAIRSVIKSAVNLTKKGKYKNLYYIVSTPGVGKSEIIKQYAEEMGYGYSVRTLALERFEKCSGVPDLIKSEDKDGKPVLNTVWSIPDLVVELNDLGSKNEFVVCLLDDWHLCGPNIQQIGFELFTHRKLNNYHIPDNVCIILAGNDKSAAGAKMQLSAIRNRSMLINAHADVDQWIEDYAMPNGVYGPAVSFFSLNENRHYFHQSDDASSKQFGSPRSWTSCFNAIESIMELDFQSDSMKEKMIKSVILGAVGDEAGTAFLTYWNIFAKTDCESIFKTGKFHISTSSNQLVEMFAQTIAITSYFYNQYIKSSTAAHKENISKIYCNYLEQLFDKQKSELAMKSITYLKYQKGDPENKILPGGKILSQLAQKQFLNKKIVTELLEITTVASMKSSDVK